MRFTEQIAIIAEEKRRVLVTLEGEACAWDARETLHREDTSPESQGKAAYAAKQATIRRKLKTKFAQQWQTLDLSAPGDEDDEDDLASADAAIHRDDQSDGAPSDYESDLED